MKKVTVIISDSDFENLKGHSSGYGRVLVSVHQVDLEGAEDVVELVGKDSDLESARRRFWAPKSGF